MGLKGDIDELSSTWTRASRLLKGWLGLSVFLSASAVASLSEIIMKWRGFFRDSLEFYKGWISEPLKELLYLFYLDLFNSTIRPLFTRLE
jgi:hypothetical protein